MESSPGGAAAESSPIDWMDEKKASEEGGRRASSHLVAVTADPLFAIGGAVGRWPQDVKIRATTMGRVRMISSKSGRRAGPTGEAAPQAHVDVGIRFTTCSAAQDSGGIPEKSVTRPKCVGKSFLQLA